MHDVHTCFSENKKAPWTTNSAGDDACPSGYERPIYHSCHPRHNIIIS